MTGDATSVERLEARTLFAAPSVAIADGVLGVGGNKASEEIVVGFDPNDPTHFLVTRNGVAMSGIPLPVTGVTGIEVNARRGNNLVRIVDDVGLTLPTTILGGGGKDTIIGGNGSDSIDGGGGDDDLSGLPGDDTIVGGTGNDNLDGGEGADSLDGGDGKDFLSGQDSNDRLLGGAGADTLVGGTGDDSLLGVAGDDRLDGGDGTDTLVGGGGVDSVRGGTGSDFFAGRYMRKELDDLTDEDSRQYQQFSSPNNDDENPVGKFLRGLWGSFF
jgi:Ca2+-binding RTX toxin-like protein